jgi:hypothetical protein
VARLDVTRYDRFWEPAVLAIAALFFLIGTTCC